MSKEFSQIVWDTQLEDDCRQLIRLAVREDLGRTFDWTTASLVGHQSQGKAAVVMRSGGIVAGLPVAKTVLEEMAPSLNWEPDFEDGAAVTAGTSIATIWGPARDLLTCERIVLNFLGRLCGVASLTQQYVQSVANTRALIYDTRKTTPGWRRLEKYAVQCGGGHNHRTGLFDAILIKDNHLALGASDSAKDAFSLCEAVAKARAFLQEQPTEEAAKQDSLQVDQEMIVEIEVDTLSQLEEVLPALPDIVLLDNMTCEQLRRAVILRDQLNPTVQLEASGGVRLQTISDIAATGVDRISVGALTHSAISIDVGLDWLNLDQE